MSERRDEPLIPLPLKIVGGIAAIIFGGGFLATKYVKSPEQQASNEKKEFIEAVASGQAVKVLENGTAKIDLEDEGRFASVINPVLTKTGHVIGRDKFTGDVVVYFVDKSSDSGKYDADKIIYAEKGEVVSKDEAIEDAKPLVLETPQKVGKSGEFAYVAADGQGFDDQPIAVATPLREVTTTTTKTVPDIPDNK